MRLKTFVICNPGAGSVDDEAGLRAKLQHLPAAEVHFTGKEGDATRLARAAVERGCEQVLAAGGDGTLNEVVNGLAEHAGEVSLGLLPLGTGNDFARTLGLPATVDECLAVIAAGHTRPVDLVRVRSDAVRYFINVSAGGFSGAVNEIMTPEIKQTWGPLAYLRCAAEALPDLRAYRTEVSLDGGTPEIFDLYNVVVANGRFVAGGTEIAPEAKIDDGLLDVVLIPENQATAIALVIAAIGLGTHLESENVIFRRAARVAIHSQPGMWFNVDGELVGNEPAVFEIMPRALRVFVPPPQS